MDQCPGLLPFGRYQLVDRGAELLVRRGVDFPEWRRSIGDAPVGPYHEQIAVGHSRLFCEGAVLLADGGSAVAGEEEGIFLATFDLDEIRGFREMEKWRLDYRKNRGN